MRGSGGESLESAQRVAAFKKKSTELKRRTAAPSPERIRRLATPLWEFGEQVRLRQLAAGAGAGRPDRVEGEVKR